MKTFLALLTASVLASLLILTACGGDNGNDTPTPRPTPTPVVEPSPQGDDDESQIRYTLESFAYYIDQNDFEKMCEQYAQSVLDTVSCDDIKGNIVGNIEQSGGEKITARIPEIRDITVDGETATADYTLCLDIGAGETCTPYVINLVHEGDRWKISG